MHIRSITPVQNVRPVATIKVPPGLSVTVEVPRNICRLLLNEMSECAVQPIFYRIISLNKELELALLWIAAY